MGNIIKVALGLLTAMFFIVVMTYVIEGPIIAVFMKTLVNYVQMSTLSTATKDMIIGRFMFIKFAWRAFVFTMSIAAFVWFVFNIYKTEADQNFL